MSDIKEKLHRRVSYSKIIVIYLGSLSEIKEMLVEDAINLHFEEKLIWFRYQVESMRIP